MGWDFLFMKTPENIRKFRKYLKDNNIQEHVIDFSDPEAIVIGAYCSLAGPYKFHFYEFSKFGMIHYTPRGQVTSNFGIYRLLIESALIDEKLIKLGIVLTVYRYSILKWIYDHQKLVKNLNDLGLNFDEYLYDRIISEDSNPKKAFKYDPRIYLSAQHNHNNYDTTYKAIDYIQSVLKESWKFYQDKNYDYNTRVLLLSKSEFSYGPALGNYTKDPKLVRYIAEHNSSKLRDYWNMRDKLKEFVNLKDYPKFPQNLSKKHDELVVFYNKYQDKLQKEKLIPLQKEYEKKFLKSAKKYEYEFEDYIIKTCSDLMELIVEGRELNHCVASYTDSVSKGKEYILFLRKKSEPEIPFYTIDLIPDGRIRQIRGKCNCLLTPELKQIIQPWIQKFNLTGNPDEIHYHLW